MFCLIYMPKLSERGVIQYVVLLILLVGIIGVVYLVTKGGPLKIFPRATVSGPISQTTSFTLVSSKKTYNVGQEVVVQILVHSDVAATNLFDAKINFDPQLLQLGRVDVTSPFIKNWVEQYWGDPGKVSLVGAVPSPGFQTRMGDIAPMATLYFTVLKQGSTSISFDDSSAIYSNADNINILVSRNPIDLTLNSGVAPTSVPTIIPNPTQAPSPISTAIPSPNPVPGSGDANGDGKINLVDLSILLSDFNKSSGFRKGIDLNGDGRINTFDFSMMRSLLIQRGVIKG